MTTDNILFPYDVTETLVKCIREDIESQCPPTGDKVTLALYALGCSALHGLTRGPDILRWLATLDAAAIEACEQATQRGDWDVAERQAAMNAGVALWRFACLETERGTSK
mgnify:FL=1